jgi:hypothetical protein
MAKPRPEKKREKNGGGQPTLPGVRDTAAPTATRLLPMQLQVGDRITDETGEWEVVNRPHTTAGGKTAHVRQTGGSARRRRGTQLGRSRARRGAALVSGTFSGHTSDAVVESATLNS